MCSSDLGRDGEETYDQAIEIEMQTAKQGVTDLANAIITGLEEVLKLPSPYPPEYREAFYKQARFMLGSEFEKMLTEEKVDELISNLKAKKVL